MSKISYWDISDSSEVKHKNKILLIIFYLTLFIFLIFIFIDIVLAYPVNYNGTAQQSIVILHNDTGCFMQINQDIQNCNGSNIFTLLFPYSGIIEIINTSSINYIQNYTNVTVAGNCTYNSTSFFNTSSLDTITFFNALFSQGFNNFESYFDSKYIKSEEEFKNIKDQVISCNNTFVFKDAQIELEKVRSNFTQNNLDECKGNSRLRDYLIIGFAIILILTFAFVLGAGYFKRRFGGGQQIDLPGLIADLKQQVQRPEIKDEIQEAKVVGEPLKFPKPPKK